MRIGMLADAYKPHISGITIYMDTYRAALEADGHEVYIFTLGNRREPGDDEHVVRSPGLPLPQRGYYITLGYSRSARELLRSMDIVHVHHPFTSGRIALRYCRPHGTPIVFTNHTRYDLYARSYARLIPPALVETLLRWYMPRFCAAIQLVISPSLGMANVLRNLGVTGQITVIPNGVDLQRFYQAKPLSRADFGYTQNDILLVYAGRIATEKNLPFLLQAFSRVAHTLKDVHLLIIGSGTNQIEAEIQRLAVGLNIDHRIRFTGLVSYEKLPAYLAMCDAFVTASVTETFGMSAVEAMGTGLPVIGIRSPGVSDVVEDGSTGLLANQDLPSFTSKLTRLCLDANLRRQMGDAARQASSRYAIERTTRIMIEHYESLVKASHPVGRTRKATCEDH